jgi:hypothetical protein
MTANGSDLPFKKESSSIYDGFTTLESTNWLTLKKPGCKQWLQAMTSPETSSADSEEAWLQAMAASYGCKL